MEGFLFALTVLAALGCATMAGVFFAFSAFVMKALARLPADQGVAAMQVINVAAVTPAFMVALFGTAVACGALTVFAFFVWDERFAPDGLLKLYDEAVARREERNGTRGDLVRRAALSEKLSDLDLERRGYLRQNARGVLLDVDLDAMLAEVDEQREAAAAELRASEDRAAEAERLRAAATLWQPPTTRCTRSGTRTRTPSRRSNT